MYSHIHRYTLTCTHAAPAWVSVRTVPTRPMGSTLPVGNGARTPKCGSGQNKGPLTRQSQPSAAAQGAVLSGSLGGSSGQHPDRKPLCSVQRTTPQARDSGHHHRPHQFLSKSLSKTNTPSAWRFRSSWAHGKPERGTQEETQVEDRKPVDGNKSPATHDAAQLPEPRARGQQKNSPKDSHGPALRSDDVLPLTADRPLQEVLCRGP